LGWQGSTGGGLASTSAGRIRGEESALLEAVPEDEITAEQSLLAGLMCFRTFRQDAFERALSLWSRAIERDPTLPEPYADAILTASAGRTVGFKGEFDRYVAIVPAWVEAARRLPRRSPYLDLALGIADFQATGEAPPLRMTIADVLRRAPFDPQVLCFAGWCHVWTGDPRAALECFERYRRHGRQGPHAVAVLGGFTNACVQIGDDEAAIAYAREGLAIADGYATFHSNLAAALALSGRQAEAEEAFVGYRRLVPDRTIESWKAVNDYAGSEGGERLFEGLRRAGMPER